MCDKCARNGTKLGGITPLVLMQPREKIGGTSIMQNVNKSVSGRGTDSVSK